MFSLLNRSIGGVVLIMEAGQSNILMPKVGVEETELFELLVFNKSHFCCDEEFLCSANLQCVL